MGTQSSKHLVIQTWFVGVVIVARLQVGMDLKCQDKQILYFCSEVLTSLLFLTFSKINHVKK
jgi:hypothetical protein